MHLGLALALVLAAGGGKARIAILSLEDKSGGELQRIAGQLDQVIVAEVARTPGVSVLSAQEIAALLGLERQKALLGCTESSCLAEISGALGASDLLTGQLGRIGTRYRLDLRLVSGSKGTITASVGDFVAGNEDALADAAVRLTRQLLVEAHLAPGPAPAAAVAGPAPGPASHAGAYAAWGLAGALAVGAAASTWATVSTFNAVHAGRAPASDADRLTWLGPLSDGLWVAAAATAGAGVYLFATAAPAAPQGSLAQVGLGGRF